MMFPCREPIPEKKAQSRLSPMNRVGLAEGELKADDPEADGSHHVLHHIRLLTEDASKTMKPICMKNTTDVRIQELVCLHQGNILSRSAWVTGFYIP